MSQYGKESSIIRFGLLGLMGLLVTAIIGTQSRGGFIALLGLGAYLFIKSDRKILLTMLIIVLVAGLSTLVSPEWVSRMDTIGAADEDASFMGRVVAWKLSFILAMQNPFFGGGFKSLEYFPVWRTLSLDFFAYPFFYTGDILPDTEKARAAHSVYFQVLGDHGFFGLAIYLSFIFAAFRAARRVAREARKHLQTQWIASVAVTMQLCIFAFCLGGAGLSFAYFELLFAICAIVQILQSRILPRELKELKAVAAATAEKPMSAINPALSPAAKS